MITKDFAHRFAADWIAAWNARDLPRVLIHYAEDFEMASPRIVDIMGEPSGVLRGKAIVADYWEKALAVNPHLHFETLGVFVGAESVALHYRHQTGLLVVEVFHFGPDGLVTRAAAHRA